MDRTEDLTASQATCSRLCPILRPKQHLFYYSRVGRIKTQEGGPVQHRERGPEATGQPTVSDQPASTRQPSASLPDSDLNLSQHDAAIEQPTTAAQSWHCQGCRLGDYVSLCGTPCSVTHTEGGFCCKSSCRMLSDGQQACFQIASEVGVQDRGRSFGSFRMTGCAQVRLHEGTERAHFCIELHSLRVTWKPQSITPHFIRGMTLSITADFEQQGHPGNPHYNDLQLSPDPRHASVHRRVVSRNMQIGRWRLAVPMAPQ